MNRVYLQREGKIRRGRKASAGIKPRSLLAEGTQGQPEGAAYFKKLICRRTNCLWYLAIPGEEGSGGEGANLTSTISLSVPPAKGVEISRWWGTRRGGGDTRNFASANLRARKSRGTAWRVAARQNNNDS